MKRRPSVSTFEVTFTNRQGDQVIMGPAAEIIASVASVAPAINATPVGKADIHLEGQALLELRCSFPPMRFDL